jgi:hypothetical protein
MPKKRATKSKSKTLKKKTVKNKKRASSPLLRSAFEVLEHGLWHFLRSETTIDMKFALLHIDQSIELLLKERVRKSGNSIYKNPKETITLYGAYDILEGKVGCKIPEKPDLELLHEERNNIQHKYANPGAEDAAFHVENAMKFIDRFTRDELGLVLADFLPSEFLLKVLP